MDIAHNEKKDALPLCNKCVYLSHMMIWPYTFNHYKRKYIFNREVYQNISKYIIQTIQKQPIQNKSNTLLHI